MSKKQEKYSLAIESMAETIELKISPEYQVGVEKNFEILTDVAKLVMEFPIDSSIEIAPKFEP